MAETEPSEPIDPSIRASFDRIAQCTARWTHDYIDNTAMLVTMSEEDFVAKVLADHEQPPLVTHIKRVADDVRRMAMAIEFMADQIHTRAEMIVNRNSAPASGA